MNLSVFKIPDIRNKILFTLFIVLVFRVLTHVTIPGVNLEAVRAFISNNQFLGLFDLFSGGGLKNFSIVILGLAPYINASIIIQLLTTIVPSLEELQKEGEYGREKINQYTKLLTLPIGILQSFGFYALLKNQVGIIPELNTIDMLVVIMSMMAGTFILMWVGDLLTEKGLGNGISLLIFVGIISALPESIYRFYELLRPESFLNALIFGLALLGVTALVVYLNEAVKNIPVEYGRRVASGGSVVNSSLPLKVNQVGVIPVIFASSVVLVPSFLGSYLVTQNFTFSTEIGNFLVSNFQANSYLYNVLMFILVVVFSYFYTSLQFNPDKISTDVKKRGGFIPGIRPGKNTSDYLRVILNRITLGGGVFLGFISILPFIIHKTIGFDAFSLGGTSLLIVVSVVLETIRKAESLMVAKKYDSFLD